MATDEAEEWDKLVVKKHNTFLEYKLWHAIKKNRVLAGAKVLTSTWAMKPKANGDKRACLNAQGFKQVDCIHYNAHDLAAPLVYDMTIRIVLVLITMANWATSLTDVKGTFLNGKFCNREQLYMTVPHRFERFYPSDVLLLLLKMIYGLKQAAIQFWHELQKAFKFMQFHYNKADLCLSYKWVNGKLNIWITWVDNCLNTGPEQEVKEVVKQMNSLFECKELGELAEYAGCKIDYNKEDG
eukprot:4667343-Ditylum_brightwellii.AAC.1